MHKAIILAAVFLIGFLIFKFLPQPQEGQVEGVQEQEINNARYLEDSFQSKLTNDPLWYLDPQVKGLIDEYLQADETTKSQEWISEKHGFFELLGKKIQEGNLSLGNGEGLTSFDEEREEVSAIVIHHTQTAPDRTKEWFNGLQLLTLYIPTFADSKSEYFKKPIWSGHFDEEGKPVFIAYHYLVYPDGKVLHILDDDEIGWHAGDWRYNKKSIGVAFVDDLSQKEPTEKAIEAANGIIGKYKQDNPKIEVTGHKEIDPGHTACPGEKFEEWKEKLSI